MIKRSDQENLLYDSLSKKDKRLGVMYIGTLIVLNDQDNPDSLPLAAHGFRELMENIPEYFDIKIPADSLKSKVNCLRDQWAVLKRSKNTTSQQHKFIKECEKFFNWYEEVSPTRGQEIAKALHKIESKAKRYLPAALEKLRVDEWDKIWDYFKTVAHHRASAERIKEFLVWKEALERFLLDRLHPRTFTDHKEIVSVINEGEKNDNS